MSDITEVDIVIDILRLGRTKLSDSISAFEDEIRLGSILVARLLIHCSITVDAWVGHRDYLCYLEC